MTESHMDDRRNALVQIVHLILDRTPQFCAIVLCIGVVGSIWAFGTSSENLKIVVAAFGPTIGLVIGHHFGQNRK